MGLFTRKEYNDKSSLKKKIRKMIAEAKELQKNDKDNYSKYQNVIDELKDILRNLSLS